MYTKQYENNKQNSSPLTIIITFRLPVKYYTTAYAEIPGHMIVLLELIQNNRFVWGNRCYVIIGLMAQILSY